MNTENCFPGCFSLFPFIISYYDFPMLSTRQTFSWRKILLWDLPQSSSVTMSRSGLEVCYSHFRILIWAATYSQSSVKWEWKYLYRTLLFIVSITSTWCHWLVETPDDAQLTLITFQPQFWSLGLSYWGKAKIPDMIELTFSGQGAENKDKK